jgi:hypothetical protein
VTAVAPVAGREDRRAAPRVPWRSLAWVAWREHRAAIIALLAAFAGTAVLLLVSGLIDHAVYASYVSHRCLTRLNPGCWQWMGEVTNGTWVLGFLPWLVAVFVGAPMVARDFDTGQYRFTMSQGVSARRQFAAKLIVTGAVVVAGGSLLGLLSMWYQNVLAPTGVNTASRWDPADFHLTALTLPAWTLLALCLGALAGAAIRRVLPAMAVALAAVLVCTLLGTGSAQLGRGQSLFGLTQATPLTQRVLSVAPVVVRDQNAPTTLFPGVQFPLDGPAGSLQVSGWLTGPAGQRLSGPATQALARQMPAQVQAHPAKLLAGWLTARRISIWAGYQPASRYWLFQGIVAAILLALAAAAGLIAVRLAGRRG